MIRLLFQGNKNYDRSEPNSLCLSFAWRCQLRFWKYRAVSKGVHHTSSHFYCTTFHFVLPLANDCSSRIRSCLNSQCVRTQNWTRAHTLGTVRYTGDSWGPRRDPSPQNGSTVYYWTNKGGTSLNFISVANVDNLILANSYYSVLFYIWFAVAST